ncbi:putative transposase [Sinorhizobium kostiense]|uniref:Transposase n=1 Tax=Sinorhizobium kostiense TaxID=76747 RepID=A0ABS4R0N9_9HYPH|nr:putative transposase [Sinorhizobium kostiense]
MKRNRFTDEQIIGILKEHKAGTPVSKPCRKHGVSDASIYKWKAKFGGMDVADLRDLTRKAERGEFSLGPMLMALMRANASTGRKAS